MVRFTRPASNGSNSPVGEALAIVNAPTNVLLGRDLIGNSVTRTAAAQRWPSGLLFGDGGAGYRR